MIEVLLQASDPSGFEISQVFLVVISLLIPAIVFLVGMFRDETELEGPFADLVSMSPSSFGRSLGLQSLAIAIIVFATNMIYILFSVVFADFALLTPSIGVVSGITGIGILLILIYLMVLIASLSGRRSETELDRVEDEVDKTILQQRNEQIREEFREHQQRTADLITQFHRLNRTLQQRDDIPDQIMDQAEELVESSGRGGEVEEMNDEDEELEESRET